ncbi:MAG TPA: hypothetical protein VK705_02720, partial [Ferruginibacter sp.]|nr:hypothetical protein [Ferruginibacter sp.]
LGIWKPNVNTPVHIACFLSKMIQRNNAMYQTIENFRKSVYESTNAGRHKKPQLELLNNFLFDQFVYEKPPYSITSYLSHEILFNNMVKEVTVEGIIYPSIESSLRYCNYAFHPFFSDRFLELQKVIEFTLNIDKELLKGDYTMGRIGVPINGTIVWKIPSKKEAKSFYNLIHQGFINDK